MRYSVQKLRNDEMLSALPLLQLRYPDLTANTWQEQAAALDRGDGGVVAVQCENGYTYGLMVFEVQTRGDVPTICVTELIGLRLTGQENCEPRLLEWIHNHASEVSCKHIEISLS